MSSLQRVLCLQEATDHVKEDNHEEGLLVAGTLVSKIQERITADIRLTHRLTCRETLVS